MYRACTILLEIRSSTDKCLDVGSPQYRQELPSSSMVPLTLHAHIYILDTTAVKTSIPFQESLQPSRAVLREHSARCVLSGIGIGVDLESERKTEILNIGHILNHKYDQTKHYHRDNNRCPFRRHLRHPLLRPLIPAVTKETAPAKRTFAKNTFAT